MGLKSIYRVNVVIIILYYNEHMMSTLLFLWDPGRLYVGNIADTVLSSLVRILRPPYLARAIPVMSLLL